MAGKFAGCVFHADFRRRTADGGLRMANEFYTLTTLGTLAGATGATVTVANTVRGLFRLNPRWVGFATAEIVCLGVLGANGAQHYSDWASRSLTAV